MLSFVAAVVGFLAAPAAGSLWEADLQRAHTRIPRAAYRGSGSLASANEQLNKHLALRKGLQLKACEDFTTESLRALLRNLLPRSSAELRGIYAESDGRRSVYATVEEMEAHWAQVGGEDSRVRDAHCHEAVMWFVHHLSSKAQKAATGLLVLPMLPVKQHTVPAGARPAADVAGKFYDEKVTCQKCHVGGIPDLGLPEVAPMTQKEKSRRCYTNYKELFNITCGPCDGVAGPYWGDSDDHFTATKCIVVAQPEDVPEKDRVQAKLPSQFSVDVVGGSDRFGRTTNPIHDQLPGPIAKIYGQISGKWFMDAKPGADLWLLRHDTIYGSVTEDGVPIPFIAPSVSEIHAQTAKQRASNLTGPMVSLIHGMPSFLPGGCTCMPDPVGVPDTQASWAKGMAGMQYMGRIKLPELEYLKTPIVLDHWANWFFHIFMDTNSSVPHYKKAPSRLASAYAGTAVYDNWVFEDPAIKDPTVWFRGIPTSPQRVGPSKGLFCMDTKKSPMCSNITQQTFPPIGEPVPPGVSAIPAGEQPPPFFPSLRVLGEHLAEQKQRAEQLLI